jgi:hypothetical protein
VPVILKKGTESHPTNAIVIGDGLGVTQTQEGLPELAATGGGGDLTQAQADLRYLQLVGGTLSGNLRVNAALGIGLAPAYPLHVFGNGVLTGSLDALTGLFVNGTAVSLAGHAHAWSDVNKAGSSLADLATRSAGDLTSGTLADARLSVDVARLNTVQTWTAAQTFNAVSLFNNSIGIGATPSFGAITRGILINHEGVSDKPGIRFDAGDAIGEIYANGANQSFTFDTRGSTGGFRWEAPGSLFAHLTGAGDFGIGVTPSSRFFVSGAHTSGRGIITAVSTDDAYISMEAANGFGAALRLRVGGGYQLDLSASASAVTFAADSIPIHLRTSGATRVTVNAGGGGTLYGDWAVTSGSTAYSQINLRTSDNIDRGYVVGKPAGVGLMNDQALFSVKCYHGTGLGGELIGTSWYRSLTDGGTLNHLAGVRVGTASTPDVAASAVPVGTLYVQRSTAAI